ncbi:MULTISPECIES: NACHT domain-containing protein [Kitasatospora]|uniref:NACHT domain-containing protein n=1 Tax=Kitasatospora cystarginea TaxID=58350 RepID=A0ABP5RYW7_9ACTN
MVFNTAIVIGDNNIQINYFKMFLPDPFERAVQKLGRVVEAQWRREARLRGLRAPEPFPVRWRASPVKETGDHLRLTGNPVAGSVANLTAFAGVFMGLTERRLVVLGGAGSGKTTLAVLLVIELLKRMSEGAPVPVLLSLASWQPGKEDLEVWLERQLLREYPHLDGDTASSLITYQRILPVLDGLDELPAADHSIALEKINEVLGQGGPLILTCRTDDYREAIGHTEVLRAAAVVEPVPLTAQEVADYLLGSATPQHQERWEPLAGALVRDPSSTVARVLTVPLNLWLCRKVYARPIKGEAPGDLADHRRFPDARAIEGHLLKSLVPSVYPSNPPPLPHPDRKAPDRWSRNVWRRDPKRVTAWFTYLARHLQERREQHLEEHLEEGPEEHLEQRREQRREPGLEWWELGTTMSLVQRLILIGLVSGTGLGLIVGVTDAIITVLTYALPGHVLVYRLGYGLLVGFVDALINGIPAALVFALVHGIGFRFRGAALEPSRVWTPIGSWAERSSARSGREIRTRAGIGFLAGLVAGAAVGPLTVLVPVLASGSATWVLAGLGYVVIFGLSFALAGGLVGALMAWLEAPIAVETAPGPRDLLDRNRRTVLLQLLMFAPLLGIVSGAGVALSDELLHHSIWGIPIHWPFTQSLRLAFLIALGGGLGSAVSLTAWGQWVVLARVWLPFTGKLPWDAMAFLEDAHRRGVLRQVGVVYEFRHELLQTYFAQLPQQRQR